MGAKIPSVGFLTFDTGGTYNSRMWQGILKAASSRNVNCITLCGGMLYSDDRMHRQWNRIYDLASSSRIDAQSGDRRHKWHSYGVRYITVYYHIDGRVQSGSHSHSKLYTKSCQSVHNNDIS